MATYFGFAIADSMFPSVCRVERVALSVADAATEVAAGVTSCLNPSHTATIQALNVRCGISVEIPPSAPRVSLQRGDSVIVMSPRGLPRLQGRHEYTEEEIRAAEFAFGKWTVK